MKTYLVRSLKYFVALCIICALIMALMLLTGTSALSLQETLYVMFRTNRFASLAVAVVVLSALYPRFGFTVRRIEGNIVENRTQIINAFKSAGFSLHSNVEETMIFRAERLPHRLLLLFEDEIHVSQSGQWIVLEGIRRGVARVEYRLDSYLRMTRHNNE